MSEGCSDRQMVLFPCSVFCIRSGGPVDSLVFKSASALLVGNVGSTVRMRRLDSNATYISRSVLGRPLPSPCSSGDTMSQVLESSMNISVACKAALPESIETYDVRESDNSGHHQRCRAGDY